MNRSMEGCNEKLLWPCQTGVVDVKQWFLSVITPDFETVEARVRCGSLSEVSDHGFSREPRLETATRMMRESSQNLNIKGPKVRRVLTDDGWVELSDDGDRPLFTRWFSKLEPGSVRSASLALMSTALGAGALAIPYAFSLTGVGLGLLTLLGAAMVSALSLQILMVAARYTGLRSYAQLLELASGSVTASLSLDLTVVLNGIGAVTCILIFEGDFVPDLFRAPPGGFDGYDLPRSYAVLGSALLAWPLILPDDISALRYLAVAVPIAVLITVAIVLCDAPEFHAEVHSLGTQGNVKWWDFEPLRWLQAAAIMVNAFANHQNAVPAATALENPSVARIVKATVNANLAVWTLLSALGIAGYMSFARTTKGDFLLNYPAGRPEIWVCRLMLSLVVFLVLPVSLMPTAKSALQLFWRLLGLGDHEITGKAHALAATILLTTCTCIALQVEDVAAVIGVLGGLLASSLMFWFPALVFWRLLWPTQPRLFRRPVLIAIVFFGACGWTSVAMNMIF